MLRLTLDTSCVIHGAQGGVSRGAVNRLVDLAREGRVAVCLTVAYDRDQERASEGYREQNERWLRDSQIVGRLPGPFRLDYSVLDGPDILATQAIGQLDEVVRRIVLPAGLHPNAMVARGPEAQLEEQEVRWLNDVQHLMAHAISQRDAFVTDDERDIISKRDQLLSEAGITVWRPAEAVRAVGGEPS